MKLSDFGLGALPNPGGQAGLLRTTCGTPNYVAPEVRPFRASPPSCLPACLPACRQAHVHMPVTSTRRLAVLCGGTWRVCAGHPGLHSRCACRAARRALQVLAKKGYLGGPADIWSLGQCPPASPPPACPASQPTAASPARAPAQQQRYSKEPACHARRAPATNPAPRHGLPPACPGVVLYVMLAGCLPFDEDDLVSLFHKISAAAYEVPPWLSDEAVSLLAAMLQPEPEARWAACRWADRGHRNMWAGLWCDWAPGRGKGQRRMLHRRTAVCQGVHAPWDLPLNPGS